MRRTSSLVLATLAAQACFFDPTGSRWLAEDTSPTGHAYSGGSSTDDETERLPGCGDSICSIEEFRGGDPACLEDCEACLVAPCHFQGDGLCESGKGESTNNSIDCKEPVCGDGMVGGLEECDDGNRVDSDACTNACKHAVCGDGVVYSDVEIYDDGNNANTDDCLDTCELARCGDGHLTLGEFFDDKAPGTTDFCATSRIHAGYVWSGLEECDDGNEILTDSCPKCNMASCGDGFVEEGTEECDDGNLDDGDLCDSTCAITTRTVFVTKDDFDGNLDGISGADIKCRDSAMNAGLAHAQHFKAWLSGEGYEPAQIFDTKFEGIYTLVNGWAVAVGWEDLTDGTLTNAINRDENGVLVSGPVWSNTDPQGYRYTVGDCLQWTTNSLSVIGTTGETSQIGGRWAQFGSLSCDSRAHLYCFEDPPEGRRLTIPSATHP